MTAEISMARTPHRVSLAGGTTDIEEFYRPHGYGATVGVAIKPFSQVTVTPRNWDDTDVMVRYSKTKEFRSTEELGEDPAQRYIREAARLVGVRDGFELTSQSGTSYSKGGSGLGSSSSFAASLLLAMHAFAGDRFAGGRLTKEEKIELAEETYYLERHRLGYHCGKQDQYTSVFGGINYFRYNSDGSVDVVPIELSVENRLRLNGQLHLFYTGMHRSAEEILKRQADGAASNVTAMLRIRDLADETLKRLQKGETDFIGEFLDRGWELKRTLVNGITNPDIDRVYKGAMEKGASGGRLIGAGAGGYLLLAVPPASHNDVKAFMREKKMQERPIASITGTLSVSASARNLLLPSEEAVLSRSFAMCEAVEALPPLPIMNIELPISRALSRTSDISAILGACSLRRRSTSTLLSMYPVMASSLPVLALFAMFVTFARRT